MKIRLDVLAQFHFLILYPSHDFATGFLQHPADVQVRAFQLEITATHPCCREDVFNDPLHVIDGFHTVAQIGIPVFVFPNLVDHSLQFTLDNGYGCLQFMGNSGKEVNPLFFLFPLPFNVFLQLLVCVLEADKCLVQAL